jgi:hypothetical protein
VTMALASGRGVWEHIFGLFKRPHRDEYLVQSTPGRSTFFFSVTGAE